MQRDKYSKTNIMSRSVKNDVDVMKIAETIAYIAITKEMEKIQMLVPNIRLYSKTYILIYFSINIQRKLIRSSYAQIHSWATPI